MNFLEVKNIYKTYPPQKQAALQNISFQIQEKECLVVVGESASGKSTLLKIIAGLLEADAGQVLLRTLPVDPPSQQLIPGHPQIKMVSQESKLFPNHTVYENISYPIRKYAPDYQKKRVQYLLALCQLEGVEKKLPAQLSGGQKQRVALAQALAEEPLLLLLDEPFSHLDQLIKQDIKAQVLSIIRASQTTAIFVLHDWQDALSIADKILLLKAGKLLQMAPPEKLYTQPSSPYIARFFGTANILNAQALKALGAPKPQRLACLRAEAIRLVKKSLKSLPVQVVQRAYLGERLRLELRTKEGISLICFSQDFTIQVHTSAFIQIDWQQLWLFENLDPEQDASH